MNLTIGSRFRRSGVVQVQVWVSWVKIFGAFEFRFGLARSGWNSDLIGLLHGTGSGLEVEITGSEAESNIHIRNAKLGVVRYILDHVRIFEGRVTLPFGFSSGPRPGPNLRKPKPNRNLTLKYPDMTQNL